uniref:Charged multivesicular body protein 7 n=1 Tax=Taeniopygia guttata TaxID=59729 RepID=H1A3V3_TAEGU
MGCVFISPGQSSSLYHPQPVDPTAPHWGETEQAEKKWGPSAFGVLNPPLVCSVLLQVENKTSVRLELSCSLAVERSWSMKFPQGTSNKWQSREVNSTEWDSKMAFWVGLVLARGRRRGAVRTCLRELQNGFERRGSVPLGLGTVLRELLRRGKLQRESDFMASVDSSWISWGVGVFILKPLKWTLSSVLGDSKIPEEEEVLIYVELLQEKAEEVYRLYQSSALSSHPVVALSELRSLCAGLCPDERTFYLLLLQLQKEKRVTILEQNGEKIVKFARGLHAKVSPMNDVDIGVYQLMQSEQLLSQKVESLSQEAEKCKEDARSACRAGKKQLALRCLKSKRRTERRIAELHSKLDAVQGILDRIYASQTDQMVFNAYQAGVGALKLSMKDVTVERAENLVDQIQELCDTQDEVAQTLAGVGINGLEVDSEARRCRVPPSPMPSWKLSWSSSLCLLEIWHKRLPLLLLNPKQLWD